MIDREKMIDWGIAFVLVFLVVSLSFLMLSAGFQITYCFLNPEQYCKYLCLKFVVVLPI